MKGKTLRYMGGLVALIALTSVGYVIAQTSTTTSTAQANIRAHVRQVRMTRASNLLNKIYSETNTTPLEIYPPNYLEALQAIADGIMADTATFLDDPAPPGPRHLKPGDKANMKWFDASVLMGSPTSEAERNSDEAQFTGIISYGFYMGNFEVTQDEYNQVIGSNPSYFTSANSYTDDFDRPVESVTWAQADAYCSALTTQAHTDGSIPAGWAYRLPTEVEWEYSCRGKSAPAHIIASQTDHSSVTSTWYGGFSEALPPIFGTLASFDMYMGASPDGYFGGSFPTTITVVETAGGSGNCSGIWAELNNSTYGIPYGVGNRSVALVHVTLSSPVFLSGDTCPIRLRWGDGYSGAIESMGDDGAGHAYFVGYDAAPNVLNAFSFGSTIRGGQANFDTHYEYDVTAGTINVSSPTFPALNMTTNIGSYQPNTFGLSDMHGNIAEWCNDYYGTYPTVTTVDPQGPTSGSLRVVRGGSWADHGVKLRRAARLGVNPSTASSHVGFRIVLAPTTPEWKTAVTTTPSIKTYGVPPTKTKDGLILVAHGWTKFAPDQSWIDTMASSISTYLSGASITDWQTYGYHWEPNSATPLPDGALVNGRQEGISLGNSIVSQGWTKVHFIAHSAGAGLIQVATEIIKAQSPSTVVQCTFLDPYVGTDFAGQSEYGNGADWSDKYSAHGDVIAALGPYTSIPLASAYNVDVTGLDPTIGNSGLFSGVAGYVLCSLYQSSHDWPVTFYQNSITSGSPSGYNGFGFPLSKEAGGWPSAPTAYPVGNITSVEVLGTAPAACAHRLEIQTATPVVQIDFSASPKASQSTSGTVTPSAGTLTLITGSPAWLSIVPTNTDAVNLISFDANYTSTGAGAAGMLSVLWDSETIGTVDERTVGQGVAHYALHFPVTESNSTHVLSFRLDPFTNVQSTVVITNVVLSQHGVTQPFSLSSTTNTLNGAIVWQLTGQAGFDYGLQATTNLASTNWTQIAVLQNTNGVVSFSDLDSTNYPMRFYRAVAPY